MRLYFFRFCPFKIDPIVVDPDRDGTDSGTVCDDEALYRSLLQLIRMISFIIVFL